eukprot:tig00021463_g21631.t1
MADADEEELFVAVDCETTGVDLRRDAIVELAAVRFVGALQADSFRTYVALPDGVELPKEASDVHGITPEQLRGAPSTGEALRGLLLFIGGARHVVGHNLLAFDKPMLESNARRAGLEAPLQEALERWAGIDTLRLARARRPEDPGFKLVDLCARIGIPLTNAHSALDDARASGLLLLALRQPGESLASLADACIPRVLASMPWGKHKGKSFADIPPDYLAWLSDRTTDADVNLSARQALAAARESSVAAALEAMARGQRWVRVSGPDYVGEGARAAATTPEAGAEGEEKGEPGAGRGPSVGRPGAGAPALPEGPLYRSFMGGAPARPAAEADPAPPRRLLCTLPAATALCREPALHMCTPPPTLRPPCRPAPAVPPGSGREEAGAAVRPRARLHPLPYTRLARLFRTMCPWIR